jgi:hypothetical protein
MFVGKKRMLDWLFSTHWVHRCRRKRFFPDSSLGDGFVRQHLADSVKRLSVELKGLLEQDLGTML